MRQIVSVAVPVVDTSAHIRYWPARLASDAGEPQSCAHRHLRLELDLPSGQAWLACRTCPQRVAAPADVFARNLAAKRRPSRTAS